MHRADADRSGYTSEELPESLALRWVYESPERPQPAWPRLDRMPFDRAFHPVIAGGTVYFGNSVDGAVYALDAGTGKIRWRFVTDAPVRFAPATYDGRLYVASDDGHLYCLDGADGHLLWKHHPGPSRAMVLGNGRMVSEWPARGGPAVRDGVVYFAAGIWPSRGIFVCALNAQTGQTIWTNDTAGHIYMAQPHGGAEAESGVTAQGYLVVTDRHVLVPTGRAVPAALDRKDGRFLYYHLQKHGKAGGATTMVSGNVFFNNGIFFDIATGMAHGQVGPGAVARSQDGLIHATTKGLVACRWIKRINTDEQGKDQTRTGLKPYCHIQQIRDSDSILVARQHAVVGSHQVVRGIDLRSERETWSAGVEGSVYSLAAAAEAIIRETGIVDGYCLDLGCGEGQLAYELAKRTELHIYAVDSDAEKVATARKKLFAAGLYGHRVTVQHRSLETTGYPKYFANLIVSARSVELGADALEWTPAERSLRPYDGAFCVGSPGGMTVRKRGPLPGAGQWTHQYADPANTTCSGDEIRGKLRPLWYRDVGQSITQRHGRGPSPLFLKGRLFSEGLDSILAVDAYNGRTLWEYPLPGVLAAYHGDHLMGTAGSHSNYCVSDSGLYVRVDDRCLRLDPVTGKKFGEFTMPPVASGGEKAKADGPRWGYIACQDGILFGTRADPGHVVAYRFREGGDLSGQLTESRSLFALDAHTGKPLWQFTANHSFRHNAIAIGKGRVFLIDRPLAMFDRRQGTKQDDEEHPTGILIALDAKTGDVVWKNDQDIYGTLLAIGTDHNALLMSYQPTRFALASEVGGRLSVFDTESGRRQWEANASYRSRPIINDRTVFAEGGAWDLATGQQPFGLKRSYGCGVLACGRDLMVFRSATLGYFDLQVQENVESFGGMRPGCWINAIPAGGLVLVPDGSAACDCSYQNKTWLALQAGD